MKKYILLISSILILILSFGYRWYFDQLIDSLFIFVLIPGILLVILFAICFGFNVESLHKERTVISIISFCILILTCLLTIFFPFRKAKLNFELELYEEKRVEVVNLVKNNELEIDSNGNAKLPKNLKMISTSGEVVIYQNDENGTQIGFWIFRGVQSGSIQLMYSTNGEELIRNNETGHPIKTVEKLKDNWYYVETDY